jgi:Cof subfamily protein (haloacid dehalogenase superfamily)
MSDESPTVRPGSKPPVSEARPERPPRLFALDVDGTLLTSDHRLTPATVAAVAHVRSRGAEVVLASSRPPRAMRPYLVELGLVGSQRFVSLQGALTGAYDEAGGFAADVAEAMPLAAALQVVELAEASGLAVNWYRHDRWLASRLDAGVRHEAEVVGLEPEIRELRDEEDGPHKLLLINLSSDLEAAARVAASLPAVLVGQQSNPSYFEITARSVDKAAAVAAYAARRGIDPAEIVAMGDGHNDLGMFRVAGISVAPANAVPATLAAADYWTASNDEDGVAAALRALLP